MRTVSSRMGERGSILLLAIIVTLIVTFVVAALVGTTVSEARNATYDLDYTQAMALAEGVTEAAQQRLLESVANFQSPEFSGVVTLDGVDYDFDIVAAGDPLRRADPDGVTMVIQPYEISAAVDIGRSRSTIRRVAELTMTPIFQYMIFSEGDLEILPGPSMTLGGRVHSNGDIYVGTGGTLTVNTEYFRATGDIYRTRKNDGSQAGGTVNIKVTGESTYRSLPSTRSSQDSDWIGYSEDRWNGTVQAGPNGVTHVAAPSVASISAHDADGNRGHYHENAGLVFVDDQAYDTHGNPISLPAGVVREVAMHDAREGVNVTVTEIDIEALAASGQFPENGLIYAYRTDTTATQPNGIRLTNGEELPAPMTVVTEDPLYIHGDFNTVEKKGSAVIADAVNLLSNAWNDTKTSSSGLPAASNTQYNVAMISGNVPTPDGGGSYSGGFENLPRFHENWNSRDAIIRGSFISIFESRFGNSPWRYGGNVYTAPRRNWTFDTDLQDIDNMPPFTPSAVFFRRVTWDDAVPVPFPVVDG